jgi:hypothetical protein
MKITKRTLVYLTEETEALAEPFGQGEASTHLSVWTRGNGYQHIHGAISLEKFPKVVLEHELEVICERLGIPLLRNCIIGRWGFREGIKNIATRHKTIIK